jgi:excisionase family DNA binding protein
MVRHGSQNPRPSQAPIWLTTRPCSPIIPEHQALSMQNHRVFRRVETVEKLLTIAQVAEFLTCSAATVRDMIHSRLIASVKVGKGHRIRQTALDAYLKRFETPAISGGPPPQMHSLAQLPVNRPSPHRRLETGTTFDYCRSGRPFGRPPFHRQAVPRRSSDCRNQDWPHLSDKGGGAEGIYREARAIRQELGYFFNALSPAQAGGGRPDKKPGPHLTHPARSP